MNTRKWILKAIVPALLTLATVGASASSIDVQQTTFMSSTGGLWAVHSGTGRTSFCNNYVHSFSSGRPNGRCVEIGNVGPSAEGYEVREVGSSMFVVSKRSGALYQCSVSHSYDRGGCAQVTTAAALR